MSSTSKRGPLRSRPPSTRTPKAGAVVERERASSSGAASPGVRPQPWPTYALLIGMLGVTYRLATGDFPVWMVVAAIAATVAAAVAVAPDLRATFPTRGLRIADGVAVIAGVVVVVAAYVFVFTESGDRLLAVRAHDGDVSVVTEAWPGSSTNEGTNDLVGIPLNAPLFNVSVQHYDGGTLTVSDPTATTLSGTTATTLTRVENRVEDVSTIFTTADPADFATWSAQQAQLLEEHTGISGLSTQILTTITTTVDDRRGTFAKTVVEAGDRTIEVRMLHAGDAAWSTWNEVVENSPTLGWYAALLARVPAAPDVTRG